MLKVGIQINNIVNKNMFVGEVDLDELSTDFLEDVVSLAASYGAKEERKEISSMGDGEERFIDLVLLFPNKMSALSFALDGLVRYEYCMFSYFEYFEERANLQDSKQDKTQLPDFITKLVKDDLN